MILDIAYEIIIKIIGIIVLTPKLSIKIKKKCLIQKIILII